MFTKELNSWGRDYALPFVLGYQCRKPLYRYILESLPTISRLWGPFGPSRHSRII